MHKQEHYLSSLPEDVEDVLRLIEKSYDIKFGRNELTPIRTFGQLTDHILSKINLVETNDCTDQQGFYKLRAAVGRIKNVPKSSIAPDTRLYQHEPG